MKYKNLCCCSVVDPPALNFNDYEGDPPQETPKEEEKSEDITKAADKLLRYIIYYIPQLTGGNSPCFYLK